MDHVYGRRALKFAADALLAAAAFALAFQLRFLDAPGGIPDRYWTMLAGTIVFVALGKAIVFSVLGLNQKWWRYFQLPDLWPVVRAAAVASGLLVAVFTLAKPYAYNLPQVGGRVRLPAHRRPAGRRPAREADDRRAA